MNRASSRAVLVSLAMPLLACGCQSGGNGGLTTSCDDLDSASSARAGACWLSEKGPFLSHESRAARPGDVLMKSSLARFYITGRPDADGYVPYAGWVIDADMVRADGEPDYDGIDGFYPVVNVAPIDADTVTIVKDGSDGQDAVVQVEGRLSAVPAVLSVQGVAPRPVPVDVTLTYSLGPDDLALRVETRLINTSRSAQEVDVGDVILFGEDEGEAFSLPGGFDDASNAHEVDAIGSSHEWRPGSDALFARDGQLRLFVGSSVRDQIGGGDGGLWGYTVTRDTLEPRETLSAVRYLAVARDISTALSPRLGFAHTATGEITGRVTAGDRPVAGARVSLFADAELRDFAGQVLTDDAGAFELAAPPKHYHIVATGRGNGEYVEVPDRVRELAEGFMPSEAKEVAVEAGESAQVDLEMGPAAHVTIAVRDGAGAPTPAKITFQAEDERPAPVVAAGERVPYPSLAVRQIVWMPAGAAEVDLEAGLYTVTASRGFTAGLDIQRHVEIAAGTTTDLAFVVPDVVEAPGQVAIDSHVHGYYSQHGEATVSERVVTAAAEGLRIHIATDHDWVADYNPAIAAAGLADRLLSVPGVELTTPYGHHCMWPLRRSSTEPRGGADLWWWGGDLDSWYQYYRDMGATVRQVAHGTDYFNRAGYDHATGELTGDAPFTWQFNAMEVHNGKGGGGRDSLVPIWLSLINHGHRVAPVAVSDSHWRVPEVGSGRTYVRVGDSSSVDADAVARAVSELRTVASTGPFIDLHSDGGGQPGDTVAVDANGEVTLAITVWAPDWIHVSDVELLRDGQVVQSWDETTVPAVTLRPSRAVWFEHSLAVHPEANTWYTVQVRGDGDLAPIYPNVQPWALTAPLFVEVEGDAPQ